MIASCPAQGIALCPAIADNVSVSTALIGTFLAYAESPAFVQVLQ